MKTDDLQEYVKDMKYKVAFHVFLDGYVPQSLNVALREHWAKRAKGREKLLAIMGVAGVGDIGSAQANEKRGVVIVQERARLLDQDNLYGSVKAMVDCMKPTIYRKKSHRNIAGFGVIIDDDARHCELKVFQAKSKVKDQGTNILILVGEEA